MTIIENKSDEKEPMYQTIGDFEIQSRLHEGPFAGTYLATNGLQPQVLLRVLRTKLVTPGWLLRAQHEVALLSKVEHPNYNAPLSCGEVGEHFFAAYSWHSGQPLSKAMSSGTWPRPGQDLTLATLNLAISVLEALQAVHQAGCVHRDLRPSHIIVAPDKKPILSGFGPLCIAQAFGREGYQASEFAMFASPESAGIIEHDLTPASDLYSLGLVLYHALTGQPPYVGGSMNEILFQHLTATPCYEAVPNNTPKVLIEFINRLMAKEVRDRYQSAESALLDAQAIADAIETGGEPAIVIGRHDQRSDLTAASFVGREEEMAQIEDGISSIKEGGHRVIIAKAKSGMGKSRLILESIRTATRSGLVVYRSVASDQVTQEPMGPLLEIVDQLARRLQNNEVALVRAREELLQYKAEIATAIPVLSKILGWQTTRLSGPGELGQDRVASAFCKVLSYCAMDGPTLICIDDCQWLDKPSIRVLELFARRSPASVFLLLGTRPEQANSERLFDCMPTATTIEFGPLTATGTCDIVESMAGKLPSAIKSAVVSMAQGSPFMATAAMRGLVESQALVPQSGQWSVDHERLADFQAASDSANILLKRLEFLDPVALEVLSIGAIAGKQFDATVPIALAGISPEVAFSTMDSVSGHGLIWFRPNGNVAFVHDKVREAVIERMSGEARRNIHRRLAEHLAIHQPESHFDLAHHYASAGLPSSAWRPALNAAVIARKRYAIDSAISQYRIAAQAIELDPETSKLDPKSKHMIESGLAEVLLLQGHYSEAEQWLDLALLSATDSLEIAKIRSQHGELAFKRGDKELAIERFEQGLIDAGHRIPKSRLELLARLGWEIAVQATHTVFPKFFVGRRDEPSESERLTWRLYSRVAHGYWYVRDKYWTLWGHLREMNLAERYTETPELAQAYSEHAPAMCLIPWHRRGLDYASRSLAIREAACDSWGKGQSQNFLSIMLYAGSAYEECLDQAQRSISVLERTGDYWEIHMAKFQAAAASYRLGQLKEATNAARSLYESAVRLGDHQASGNAVDLWARASLGQVPKDVVRLESQRPRRDHQGNCQMWLAEGVQLHMAERYDEAITCFRKSVDAVSKTGVMNAYITPNYCWLATSLRCKLEKSPPKITQIRKAFIRELGRAARKAIWVSLRFRNDMPHALREYAAYLTYTARQNRAIKMLRKSIRTATQQGASYEVALSELMLAEIQAEASPECAISKSALDEAQRKIGRFVKSVKCDSAAASLSLIERFESLLDSGREISAAQSVTAILERTNAAAKSLLRGEKTLILEEVISDVTDNALTKQYQCVGSQEEFDASLVQEVSDTSSAIVRGCEKRTKHGITSEQTGAFLCCPIQCGTKKRFLYVANTQFTNLYGDDERKIASYLSSAAGSALDRCSHFEHLEKRVAERTRDVVQRSKELEHTARKLMRTKDQLKEAKEKAERASSSKSEFLACMSHEIRTPMTAVLGFTEILINRDVDPDEHLRYLRRIQSNGTHLLSLLNDVLDFSKIEAGRMDLEMVSCLPYDLVQDAVSALESRAQEKCIELKLVVDGTIPEFIQTDPTRLRQIVTNLVGNAIKFTNTGSVTVTLRRDLVGEEPRLEIDVTDTGIGITPDQYRQIFQPFSQADASTTRRFGGTGLGLTISKRLTQALGGDLFVASEVDCGSSFVASIAVGDIRDVRMLSAEDTLLARERQPHAQRRIVTLTNMNILVVDDVEANRELIGFLISGSGANVTYAVNGREAVNCVLDLKDKGSEFDLVLMDMQMPVLDGYSATKQLRDASVTTPIVALTANNLKGDADKCVSAGCDAYLAKPIDFDLLLETAEQYWPGPTTSAQISVNEEPESADSKPTTASRTASDIASDIDNSNDQQLESLLVNLRSTFAQSVCERMDEIRVAIDARDTQELLVVTHWLRGTSGTIGMPALSELAEEFESQVKQQEFSSLNVLADDIQSEVDLVTVTANEDGPATS